MQKLIDLSLFMEQNCKQKNNLIDYITEHICKQSVSDCSAEQIKGMVKILNELKRLSNRYYIK